ncbi:sex comb on midleg-like protein 1 [Phodopus roborovskii]|uniref:sex comb on midleg-like protein 1 n=1 Tax=Phodopus roborovskii TaxID=109678 RepID=UPI0021E3E0B7|nr:sex comb on midleg-like protein 1 [Phodopus roborovskii]
MHMNPLLQWQVVIYKTVQRLEKKFDHMNEKVTKIYQSRARSFWRYPPLRSTTRRYSYLTSKRLKMQRLRRFIHDNSISYPQSYSPTSPVRTRDEGSQDMENIQTIDYTQTFQYADAIDNTQTFQYDDAIDNTQTFQYSDSIDNTQTFQYSGSIESNQTFQYSDSIDSNQTFQYSDSIDNTQTFQYSDSINNSQSIQNTENNSDSSPERDYQETPPSPTYTAQTYQQYYRYKNIPGSSTMTYYSDIENTTSDTITSATSTVKEASPLPPGELIPIQNPEMKRLALLEAQRVPMIDPTTFGSSSQCNDAVVRHLGNPLNWSVNDVITFLNRLDPPLADQLYPTIRKHDIDGKALLLLNIDVMIKYMKMKVGVAMKFGSYIQKLKEGVNCGQ